MSNVARDCRELKRQGRPLRWQRPGFPSVYPGLVQVHQWCLNFRNISCQHLYLHGNQCYVASDINDAMLHGPCSWWHHHGLLCEHTHGHGCYRLIPNTPIGQFGCMSSLNKTHDQDGRQSSSQGPMSDRAGSKELGNRYRNCLQTARKTDMAGDKSNHANLTDNWKWSIAGKVKDGLKANKSTKSGPVL